MRADFHLFVAATSSSYIGRGALSGTLHSRQVLQGAGGWPKSRRAAGSARFPRSQLPPPGLQRQSSATSLGPGRLGCFAAERPSLLHGSDTVTPRASSATARIQFRGWACASGSSSAPAEEAPPDFERRPRLRPQCSPKVRWLAEQLVSLSQLEADQVCSSLKERMTPLANRQTGDQKDWQPQIPGNFTFFPHPVGLFAAATGSARVVGVGAPNVRALAATVICASAHVSLVLLAFGVSGL
ncbi:hypothetical protein BESB_069480 [Besnoitia besnoiti]|uniref:Uncharacterized protein n=1 Tax=Besnoitia besnoiti TaxID=94643 RepID=A0A2A9MA97_BESBE|nr:hypothetical protein BESB_069480 [Besnoitia besnoiti]PFH34915.1 hypothetical protein BESB_069480 [Besnoitia besnoiti]